MRLPRAVEERTPLSLAPSAALSRAHFNAMRFASEPPLVSVPKLFSPYPMISQSQPSTRVSITLADGELRHTAPFWLIVEARASAQTPMANGVGLNSPK